MVSEAFAMASNGAAEQGGRSPYEGLIMLVLMFGIFYFLLIRPQQKRSKAQKKLIEAIKAGDQVVTAGGIHGKIVAVEDSIVTLEIATGIRIRINRGSVVATKQD